MKIEYVSNNINKRTQTIAHGPRVKPLNHLNMDNFIFLFVHLLKCIKLCLQDGTPVGAISRVVTHPTLPLSITGHEDRHIRFFDNRTGKQTHSMVAHLDAVTSLAIDGHGLYLISGSKSRTEL